MLRVLCCALSRCLSASIFVAPFLSDGFQLGGAAPYLANETVVLSSRGSLTDLAMCPLGRECQRNMIHCVVVL